jgi:hypothetical protein
MTGSLLLAILGSLPELFALLSNIYASAKQKASDQQTVNSVFKEELSDALTLIQEAQAARASVRAQSPDELLKSDGFRRD